MISRCRKMTKDNSVETGDFPEEFELAQTGKGSQHMNAETGFAFAKYCLTMGFGVSVMEAYGTGESRGKHGLWHQILNVDDPGENWEDHKCPARALELVKEKMRLASEDGVVLMYKFWIDSSKRNTGV
jgi:hypothetical protein